MGVLGIFSIMALSITKNTTLSSYQNNLDVGRCYAEVNKQYRIFNCYAEYLFAEHVLGIFEHTDIQNHNKKPFTQHLA
jgi:hypothetical protein